MINRKKELCCTHLLCPSVLLYIHCLSCNMFFSCPYMVTVVLSITLAAEDVTAFVSVNKQFKKIHQLIRYNKVFHFISLIFPLTKIAVVGGSGPCVCIVVSPVGLSFDIAIHAFCRAEVSPWWHHRKCICPTTKSYLSFLLICLEICQPTHIGMVQCQ